MVVYREVEKFLEVRFFFGVFGWVLISVYLWGDFLRMEKNNLKGFEGKIFKVFIRLGIVLFIS